MPVCPCVQVCVRASVLVFGAMDDINSCCALEQECQKSKNDVLINDELESVELSKEHVLPAWGRALNLWFSNLASICCDPQDQQITCKLDWETEPKLEPKPELHFELNMFSGATTSVNKENLETQEVLDQSISAQDNALAVQTAQDTALAVQTKDDQRNLGKVQATPSQCKQNTIDRSGRIPVQAHLDRLRNICSKLIQNVDQDKSVCDRFDRRVERAQAYWTKMMIMQQKATERYTARASQLLKVMMAITRGEHVKTLTLQTDTARLVLQNACEDLVQVQAAFDAAAAEVTS